MIWQNLKHGGFEKGERIKYFKLPRLLVTHSRAGMLSASYLPRMFRDILLVIPFCALQYILDLLENKTGHT